MGFETVIGLEIHVELATKSKIFCSCPTTFGAKPNENTCPVCTGLPGTLPVLNETVVDYAIKAGKALDCKIGLINKMDRKNYFYPDLPKAFQVTQFDLPICLGGKVDIELDGKKKTINLTRIHMEEDAGKLIHVDGEEVTLVDYNRTGVPLIEIVSEPEMRSPAEAIAFLKNLKAILEYSEVSDCRMEQGSLRCDANISIRKAGTDDLNTRVEIKNLNSFKEVHKALLKEEKRQKELYRFGEEHKIRQETRKWDAAKGRTVPMRSKEDAHDYRYFPEPDLPPVYIAQEQVDEIESSLPELPKEKKERFATEYGLGEKAIDVIIAEKHIAEYFEEVVSYKVDPKTASNWILTELLRVLKDSSDEREIPVSAKRLAELTELVKSNTISRTAAKDVFAKLVGTDRCPAEIVEELGLSQVSDTSELLKIISETIEAHPQAIEDYKAGADKAVGFLVGQIMRQTKGAANPQAVKEIMTAELEKL